MVDTIEKALYQLRIVSFILGVGIFRDSLNNPRCHLSILYMFIFWTVYAYFFYYVVIYFKPIQIFPYFINIFIVKINILVTITSIIITICRHKKFTICLKRLDLVADTLEELGIPKECRKMYNTLKWMLILWLVMTSVTLSVDALWCAEKFNDIKAIIIPLVGDYTLHINTLADVMFVFLLRCIGIKLDKINSHIEKLSENEEYGLRCNWKKSIVVTRPFIRNMDNHRRVLWITMHLHSELCQVARDINGMFGIQMTLQMTCYFMVLTGMIYFQYNTMLCLKQVYASDRVDPKFILFTDMWFTIFFIRLISMNHICENVSAKTQKTKDVIHKLTNLIRFTEAREEIYQFILHISLRPLKFTGMDLFCFGYNFIHKFFVRILTFIIIMMQMRTSAISQVASVADKDNMTCYTFIH